MERFRLARQKMEHFFGRNIEYAIDCKNIAVVLARLERWDKAIETQREALALIQQIAGSDSRAAVDAGKMLRRMQDRRNGR